MRLLKEAQENYPERLGAISGAQQYVHFESYVIHEDDTGREFADALISKAHAVRAAFAVLAKKLGAILT